MHAFLIPHAHQRLIGSALLPVVLVPITVGTSPIVVYGGSRDGCILISDPEHKMAAELKISWHTNSKKRHKLDCGALCKTRGLVGIH